MSTTITYNNTTSAPFSKTTKYLNTAGKWVEQDIRVTDTGMSEDDSLYQDMNGFITLSDDYSTATRIEPLTVTENGTHTAPANTGYSPVEVAVPSSEFIKSVIDKSVTQITDDDLVGITNISAYSFYGCMSLETVNLSSWTGTTDTNDNNWIFGYAGDITKTIIVLPSLIYFGSRMFRSAHCKIIDIGKNAIGTIREDTFYSTDDNNATVEILILRRSDDVSPAITENAIRGVRTVYVPNDLIESYQTATNWSTKYNNGIITFLPIEGSQYEHYYADGTPIE